MNSEHLRKVLLQIEKILIGFMGLAGAFIEEEDRKKIIRIKIKKIIKEYLSLLKKLVNLILVDIEWILHELMHLMKSWG